MATACSVTLRTLRPRVPHIREARQPQVLRISSDLIGELSAGRKLAGGHHLEALLTALKHCIARARPTSVAEAKVCQFAM